MTSSELESFIKGLHFQYEVWKEDETRLWQTAGLSKDLSIADIGCGPGFSSLDLSALVQEEGQIYSVDTNSNFLSHLEIEAKKTRTEKYQNYPWRYFQSSHSTD